MINDRGGITYVIAESKPIKLRKMNNAPTMTNALPKFAIILKFLGSGIGCYCLAT
ncbi:hypothetical protein [Vulcanisaeta sp. JCM 14467]|uniref:hypothetical protein n=1 Tax=Vulcanisaeta sp. JCM 14467 TaxID=1295370 RepID=UPI000AA274FC|nr:hypothetical protein [Vulcanisaeta sp. JCM 14467]